MSTRLRDARCLDVRQLITVRFNRRYSTYTNSGYDRYFLFDVRFCWLHVPIHRMVPFSAARNCGVLWVGSMTSFAPRRDIQVTYVEHGVSNSQVISVPSTVSPEVLPLTAAPPPSSWNVHPQSVAEWQAFRANYSAQILTELPSIRRQLGVRLDHPVMAGVKINILTPQTIATRNEHRVLLHFHGVGYVLNPGEAGTREAMYMAAFGHAKVISVDYRLAPENPYPAALDDAMAVYRELIATNAADRIGAFGTSSGGGLILAMVLRAKSEGLPLPGAIAPGSPQSDMTPTGDTYMTLKFIDNFLVSYDGWLKDALAAYANGHEMKDPLLSPGLRQLRGSASSDSNLRHS